MEILKYIKIVYKYRTWVNILSFQHCQLYLGSSKLTDVFFQSFKFTPVSSLSFSEFPPITNEQERTNYKREFDREHQEYKDMQAELDTINKNLSDVDRELDELQEGSPEYLVRAHCYCLIFICSIPL